MNHCVNGMQVDVDVMRVLRGGRGKDVMYRQ